MMPKDQVVQAQEILEKKNNGSEVQIFPDACHGFTVRGDQNNEDEKKWKDEAAENAIKFFQKYLSSSSSV